MNRIELAALAGGEAVSRKSTFAARFAISVNGSGRKSGRAWPFSRARGLLKFQAGLVRLNVRRR
jgi:hypothetical protein